MKKLKVALLINLVAPNRIALYQRLAEMFDLYILHGEMEGNRTSWKEVAVPGATMCKVKGWQFSLPKRKNGQIFDRWFLHLEPGYLTDLLRIRPDAVITFEMGFRTAVALAYGRFYRKPVWVWWGGTIHTEAGIGRLRRMIRKIISRTAKQWISYGQTSSEYLSTIGVDQKRIVQIQNSVDESWFDTNASAALELHPKPVLLHVGQLIARKGVDRLINACVQLQREGAVFSLLLVGGGQDELYIRKLIDQSGLRNVYLRPAQPASLMPSFYRSADALIFPTMEDVWGLVANEAILSGLPVLCSTYAGCAPELFSPECIVDPCDEQAFLNGLRRAVAGTLPRADRNRIWSTERIAARIQSAILFATADGSKNPAAQQGPAATSFAEEQEPSRLEEIHLGGRR